MLLVHNHPHDTGIPMPSDADLEVAAEYAKDGIGFAITNNTLSELYIVVEPRPLDEMVPTPTCKPPHTISLGPLFVIWSWMNR
jgi:hypothetical protein